MSCAGLILKESVIDRHGHRKAGGTAAIICNRDPVVTGACCKTRTGRAFGEFDAVAARADVTGQLLTATGRQNVSPHAAAGQRPVNRCRRMSASESDPCLTVDICTADKHQDANCEGRYFLVKH